jgi:triacylglycerol lipase
MKRLILPLVLAAFSVPVVSRAELPPVAAKALADMGYKNDAGATHKIFEQLQPKDPVAVAGLRAERDIAYGPDPKQKLDVISDGKTAGNRPVVVFVHGGGERADKHVPGQFANDNLMKWATEQGMIGVDINYRYIPYPDRVDDVRDALAWVAKNSARYGADPNRIFLWGHSLGASLVALYVAHPEHHYKPGGGIIGAVMMSGGYEPKPNDLFGHDEEKVKAASPVEGLKATKVPLFIARAEFDQKGDSEQTEMIHKVLAEVRHDHFYLVMAGHNHTSQIFSVGTSEHQLTDPLGSWLKQRAASVKSAAN